jgi:hypothetical protein
MSFSGQLTGASAIGLLRAHQIMQDTMNGAVGRIAKLFCIREVLASDLGLKTV